MSDEILCYCYKAKKSDVIDSLVYNNYNINKLQKKLKIGTKCGACNADLEFLLENIIKGRKKKQTSRKSLLKKSFFSNMVSKFLPNIYKYYLESAFYIQNSEISTYLICGNWGIDFKKNSSLVEYECSLKIFGSNGKLYLKKNMTLKQNKSIELDFAQFKKIPEDGWFLFYLQPKSKGLEGSIRPQVLIKGKNFVTSYHPQPHWLACCEKSIIDYLFQGKKRSKLSIINASRNVNKISIFYKNLKNSNGKDELLETFLMPPLSSKLHTLGKNKKNFKDNLKLITVKSDYPTRKHIINIQENSSWNIDHFPNAK